MTVDSTPPAVALARHFVLDVAAELLATLDPAWVTAGAAAQSAAQSLAQSLAESLELVTSELVTNAVQASVRRGDVAPIQLMVEVDEYCMRLSVADSDAAAPAPRTAHSGAETGRGLAIVDTLAASWGTRRDEVGTGKTVWAEFLRPSAPPSPPPSPPTSPPTSPPLGPPLM